MEQKKCSRLYLLIKWCVKTCYPKIRVMGEEKLPQEPVILVANHCQMHGPIACELYAPGDHYTWCAGEMMHLKEVPDYAYQDFWSGKPRGVRWFYRLLSYLIAPLSVCVFNNANTIGVYRDTRILSTFKQTVQRLQEGNHVVIFPEHSVPYNSVVCRFQERFVDVAKLYHKRTGKSLQFVPMYLAPDLKCMCLGEPLVFDPEQPMDAQRRQICQELMDRITAMAQALPPHTVVPYNNIPRRAYPSSRAPR